MFISVGTCDQSGSCILDLLKFLYGLQGQPYIESIVVVKSCLTLRDPMDQSTPGPPVFHCLPEFGQIHFGSFDDTVQPFRPLSSPSPLAFALSQHWGLFQGVFSSHEMAKVLEPHLQELSFQ